MLETWLYHDVKVTTGVNICYCLAILISVVATSTTKVTYYYVSLIS